MFVLNDDIIETSIDSTSAFIISTVAKETGYYWDSIPEMIDMFLKELL